MKTWTFTFALLALSLAGCLTPPGLNDASKWTIELASSESSPSGACRIYDESHRLTLQGALISGKMDGTWTLFGSDGTRTMVWSYRQGVHNGPVQMWFGAFSYPEARGRLKLEGSFTNGEYDGTLTRYYPSGARQSVCVYVHGVLKTSQSFSPSGEEAPAASASKQAAWELDRDRIYLSLIEDAVARALAQAHREVKP